MLFRQFIKHEVDRTYHRGRIRLMKLLRMRKLVRRKRLMRMRRLRSRIGLRKVRRRGVASLRLCVRRDMAMIWKTVMSMVHYYKSFGLLLVKTFLE